MSAAEELLRAFATDRQIPDFAIDTDGRAGLTVDGKVQVDLKADGDRLYVYSSLGPLPAANEEAVLTVLLAANRRGALGEGPVMSIDPTLGDIVLSQQLDARTASSATMMRTVAGVVEQVEAWRRRLGEIDALLQEEPQPENRVEKLTFLMNRA
jgi:hypothetical protein